MCLLRRVDVLKCSCNRRVFTDATCTPSRFLEQHQRKSVHITHCVLFQRRSFDVCSAIYECWTKVAHSLKLSFELHTAHLSNYTCSWSTRVNFSYTDVFRSWSYSTIRFSTVLWPTQCFLVGGSCSSLDDGPDQLRGFDVPRCPDILSVQIQFCRTPRKLVQIFSSCWTLFRALYKMYYAWLMIVKSHNPNLMPIFSDDLKTNNGTPIKLVSPCNQCMLTSITWKQSSTSSLYIESLH